MVGQCCSLCVSHLVKVEERATGRVAWKMYAAYLGSWSPFYVLPILLITASIADRGLQQVLHYSPVNI